MDTKLHSLLSLHKAAVAQAWYDAIIGSYPADSAKFFQAERDCIANPVGQNIASAARTIIDELIRDPSGPSEALSSALDSVVRIRAVQGFTAGQAVGFVFALKDVIEQQLGADADAEALRHFDRLVDNLALHAFEIYMACREKMAEIRINEVKKRTYKLVERFNALPPQTKRGASGQGPGASRDEQTTDDDPRATASTKKQD